MVTRKSREGQTRREERKRETRRKARIKFLMILDASVKGLLFEEKTRLGSTPPSCHNKCNQCYPCMAVQVPTIPSHDRVEPGMTRSFPMMFFDPSHPGSNNKYSNYKPLGWKCHCGDHFFNP
ncbi:hypothetical protein ACE6H2_020822 [Prunus campanulata]